ncbi:hypothetical protein [Chitinimonas koreensis]|uniref:hypothetical protein n=1 Tax=Chitinimonas koreensis TaxID=356302 RepID=UPI0016545E3E|nr:hypothetical protein [Chitinimonas koreensis]QNM95671.1 hypothetical protein H9L41_17695 [Chitinimonas koreensis]
MTDFKTVPVVFPQAARKPVTGSPAEHWLNNADVIRSVTATLALTSANHPTTTSRWPGPTRSAANRTWASAR